MPMQSRSVAMLLLAGVFTGCQAKPVTLEPGCLILTPNLLPERASRIVMVSALEAANHLPVGSKRTIVPSAEFAA